MKSKQSEIIELLHVQPSIDVVAETRARIDFLKEYLLKHSFLKTYILGISGGQDSTLVGKLTQLAIAELRAETKDEAYQFITIRLPYGTQMDESDAQLALDFIRPDKRMVINIQSTVDQLVEEAQKNKLLISDFNKGNIKARARMMAQFAIAGQFQGAVLGTDHAAEAVTGFYTKFGDGAADLLPISGLTKGQGRQMLTYLEAPRALYEKIPTADLEDDKPLLPDEEALGVSYEAMDAYLEGKQVDQAVQDRIEQLYHKSEHKRHLPITPFDGFWRG